MSAGPPGQHVWPLRMTAEFTYENDLPAPVFVMQAASVNVPARFSCVASVPQMNDLPVGAPGDGSPFFRVADFTMHCRSAVAAEEAEERIVSAVQDLVENLAAAQLLEDVNIFELMPQEPVFSTSSSAIALYRGVALRFTFVLRDPTGQAVELTEDWDWSCGLSTTPDGTGDVISIPMALQADGSLLVDYPTGGLLAPATYWMQIRVTQPGGSEPFFTSLRRLIVKEPIAELT
jgi:hypothetical protein